MSDTLIQMLEGLHEGLHAAPPLPPEPPPPPPTPLWAQRFRVPGLNIDVPVWAGLAGGALVLWLLLQGRRPTPVAGLTGLRLR